MPNKQNKHHTIQTQNHTTNKKEHKKDIPLFVVLQKVVIQKGTVQCTTHTNTMCLFCYVLCCVVWFGLCAVRVWVDLYCYCLYCSTFIPHKILQTLHNPAGDPTLHCPLNLTLILPKTIQNGTLHDTQSLAPF